MPQRGIHRERHTLLTSHLIMLHILWYLVKTRLLSYSLLYLLTHMNDCIVDKTNTSSIFTPCPLY